MRITPVGVATPCSDLKFLVDRVVEVSRVTHNTGVALLGAAAIAAAVSAGVEGAGVGDAIAHAVAAAKLAAGRGHWVAAADVAARITWATGLVAGLAADEVMGRVYALVGTSLSAQESVPAAFAVLAACPGDPWLACRMAASLGGDCDTIAAMTGAVGGACHGAPAFPPSARRTVTRVNRAAAGRASPPICWPFGPRRARARRSRAASGPALRAPCCGRRGGVTYSPVRPAAAPGQRGRRRCAGGARAAGARRRRAGQRQRMTPGGGFNVMAAAARHGLPRRLRGRRRHRAVRGAGPRRACGRRASRSCSRRRRTSTPDSWSASSTPRRADVRDQPRRRGDPDRRGSERGAGRPARRGLPVRVRAALPRQSAGAA